MESNHSRRGRGSVSDIAPCELLTWDSEFWGFPVARVLGEELSQARAEAIDRWCRERAVRCLYFLVGSANRQAAHAAEAAAFRLVDIRMTFERHLHGIITSEETADPFPGGLDPALSTPSPGLRVRPAEAADVCTLQRIARSAYRETRFYYDENFPRARCDALYETWIARSCQGYAQAVLVADVEGTAVGYVTCHVLKDGSLGSIGLVGVSGEAAGHGVGQTLVLASLDWFEARGVRTVEVVTQARNVPAQRLYQRCGFLTRQVQLWYHKWYAAPG